jgi:ABC-type thiamine transport system substrate-binding protein
MMAVTILLILTVALTGCTSGGKEAAPANGGESTPAAKKEEVTIKVAGFSDFFKGDESPGMKVVKDFNEKNNRSVHAFRTVQHSNSSGDFH